MDPQKRRENHRQYMREKYGRDPEHRRKQIARANRGRDRRRAAIRAEIHAFRERGCRVCPEREPVCMSAHHRRDKKFTIGEAERLPVTLACLRAELAKCVCLCENCHRKFHAGLITLPPE